MLFPKKLNFRKITRFFLQYSFILLLQSIFILFFPLSIYCRQFKINVVARSNGVGLDMDKKILSEALKDLGHHVTCKTFNDALDDTWKADINIFIEANPNKWLNFAKINWFIPNPEWCYPETIKDSTFLRKINLILCRTKEVEKIFKKLKFSTYFLGFSSVDCFQKASIKDYSKFFHCAGSSKHKGTALIFKVWRKNPLFPSLISLIHPIRKNRFLEEEIPKNIDLILKRIEKSELIELQNSCGVHLCLSETEGFGHYIMEGMSTGAIIITTDAPPMNEFIKDQRCLVSYSNLERNKLATNFYADEESLEKIVKNLISLPQQELKKIGENNRKTYEEKTLEFKNNLENLLKLVN